jgi:hypothetical protein
LQCEARPHSNLKLGAFGASPGDGALLQKYLTAISRIDGWLELKDLTIVQALSVWQLESHVNGSIVEIGVHHGKLLILLQILAPLTDPVVGIDLFEDRQQENVDRSGSGSLQAFRRNLADFAAAAGRNVAPVTFNSLEIPVCFFHEKGFFPVRLFSVDGGHLEDNAYTDLWTAAASLAPGGVIMLDDFHHSHGVFNAAVRFVSTTIALEDPIVPFLQGDNKLYLCRLAWHAFYLKRAEALCSERKWHCNARHFAGRSHLLVSNPRFLLAEVVSPPAE